PASRRRASDDVEVLVDAELGGAMRCGVERLPRLGRMQQPRAQSRNVYAYRHSEAGHDVHPAVGERAILDAVLEHRDVRRGEVLRENFTEIDARLAADVILHLPAGHG